MKMLNMAVCAVVVCMCIAAPVPAAQMRVQKLEGTPPLTQDDVTWLNAKEKEWASDIDRAVGAMRAMDTRSAGMSMKKANASISDMKEFLLKKGYIVGSIDRMEAMERLTVAYDNLAQAADYIIDSRALAANVNTVRRLITDAREQLMQAYVRFYEVPQLQQLCKQFIAVLDQFEGEIRKSGVR